MAIPEFQSFLLPLLVFAGDGKEHSLREAIEALADHFQLDTNDRNVLLPSGRQATFDNRVGWARTYLKKAGLLASTKRSYFQITARGQEVLASKPSQINVAFLRQFPEFVEFHRGQNKDTGIPITEEVERTTPDDRLWSRSEYSSFLRTQTYRHRLF